MDYDFFNDAEVTFAADWHGQTGHALGIIRNSPNRVIYQLGDFGLWPGTHGVKYLTKLEKALRESDKYLLVTLGNHEDYNRLKRWTPNELGFLTTKTYPHIWVIPRGHIWTQYIYRFASLGGAASVDKDWRTPNVSWWEQEAITEADIINLENNWVLGGDVDFMLTHEVPEGVDLGEHYAFHVPDHIQRYADEQRYMIRIGTDIVKPKILLHGHWHKYMRWRLNTDGYYTEGIGLDRDGTEKNAITMNLDNPEGFKFVSAYR